MNKFKIFILELTLILTAIIIVFFIFKYINQSTAEYINPNENKNLGNSADLIIQNFYLKQINEQDKNLWQINAKEGKLFKKENKIECEEIICKLIKQDQIIANFYSKFSIFDQNQKKIYLKNNIDCNFNKFNIKAKTGIINLKEYKITLEENVETIITNET